MIAVLSLVGNVRWRLLSVTPESLFATSHFYKSGMFRNKFNWIDEVL